MATGASATPADPIVREEPHVAEGWDWRQSYAQYADMPEVQDLQRGVPEGPEMVAGGYQLPAAPYGTPQDFVRPPGHGPYAGAYPQYAGYPPPPVARQGGHAFSITAFVCGGIALLFLPFILGPLGIIFGFVANAKGDRIGKWAGVMSIATTVLGVAFSLWVARGLGAHFGG